MNLSNNAAQSSYPKNVSFEQVDSEKVCSASLENLEIQKEKERQIIEKTKLDDLSDRFSEIVKFIMIPNLLDKFRDFGYDFIQFGSCDVNNKDVNISFSVDIKFQSCDKAMLVNTKINLTLNDIHYHIKCLENMRKHDDLRGYTYCKRHPYLGAVAGIIIPENIKENALKQGFFVIEPSGGTFNITPPHGKPKQW